MKYSNYCKWWMLPCLVVNARVLVLLAVQATCSACGSNLRVTWSSLLHLIAAICPSLTMLVTWDLLRCNSELSGICSFVSLCNHRHQVFTQPTMIWQSTCLLISILSLKLKIWIASKICFYCYYNGTFQSISMNYRGSIPDKGRVVFLRHNFQSTSVAHPLQWARRFFRI
jgi:hypothetical protein